MSALAHGGERIGAAGPAEPPREIHANGVRIAHPPIAVHLTPFAPGCERLAIGHPDRWRTFHARPAISVVRTVLTRLRLDPAACRASAEPNGDSGLLAPVPPERLRLVAADDQDLAGAPVPQALFFDGLTPAQLGACLTELAQARWTPIPKDPL